MVVVVGVGGADVAHAFVVDIVVEHFSDRVLDSIFVVGHSFHGLRLGLTR